MSDMRVETFDNKTARAVLTALVTDPVVLSRVTPRWEDNGLFSSREENLIAGWCVDYFAQYGKPPGRAIEGCFARWAESSQDRAMVALVERLLAGLSGDYERADDAPSPEFVVDLAARHFNRVKVEKLRSLLEGDLAKGEIDEALARVGSFNKLEIGTGGWIDLLRDREVMQAAFDSSADVLLSYPGDAGDFYGDAFSRDSFVAFIGTEKKGKSYKLLDVAWRAMLQRRKVAYFQVGDMSRNQVMRRFMTRAVGRPLRATRPERPVRYPIAFKGGTPLTLEYEERVYPDDLTWVDAYKACKRVIRYKLKSDECLLRLSCHPNHSLSVLGLRDILQAWAREGWVADVTVIDYADILAPYPGYQESRDQINATWSTLRSLSQELHCCLVTASQATRAAYKAQLLTLEHNSEDKRKAAHVTAMYGLNQNPHEKQESFMRVNCMALREGESSGGRCVTQAQCLSVANPCVLSSF